MSEKVLTIQRSKWRRGGWQKCEEFGPTLLLNTRGYMCCLGFDALACGVTEKQIAIAGNPYALRNESVPETYRLTRIAQCEVGDSFVRKAIDANDDEHIDEAVRESLVGEALRGLGWDRVEFVD